MTRRGTWTPVLLGLLAAACAGGGHGYEPAAGGEPVSGAWDFEEARQFDFWIGEWDVNLRIRQEDFSWQDKVQARAHIYRILDGKAILELWDSKTIKGFSIRYFDAESEKWKLWLNWPGKNRSGGSGLEGSFRHGRGEFFSTFTANDGKEGISRYTFTDITPESLRWEDAYSVDGGETWSNNWIMEFSRTAAAPEWPIPGDEAPTYETGERCDRDEFRLFEKLAGRWTGPVESDDGAIANAILRGHKITDGCAVITYLEAGDLKVFRLHTFNTYASMHQEDRLDNREGAGILTLYGSRHGRTVNLRNRNERRKVEWTFESDDTLRLAEFESNPDGDWLPLRTATLTRAP